MIQIEESIVIREALLSVLLDVHTMLPGKIVSYDTSTKTADIKLMIKRILPTSIVGEYDEEALPILKNVPVLPVLKTEAFCIYTPVAAGDSGKVIFSEVSIGQWRALGKEAIPEDAGRHTLAGAVFEPNMVPDSEMSEFIPPENGLVITTNTGVYISVNTDGTIKLINSAGSVELAATGRVSINGTNLTVEP